MKDGRPHGLVLCGLHKSTRYKYAESSNYPVLREADGASAARARKVDQLVIDDKGFCATRINEASEVHGGFVVICHNFMNGASKKEEIEFGDDKNCQPNRERKASHGRRARSCSEDSHFFEEAYERRQLDIPVRRFETIMRLIWHCRDLSWGIDEIRRSVAKMERDGT